MFKNLFSKANTAVVGLEFQAGGIALVVQEPKNDIASVTAVTVLEFDHPDDAEGLLRQWVHDNKLSHRSCNVVLSQSDYQLILVEPPDVEDGELRDAIRWRLKDLLTIPVESAAIDVFSLPNDGTRANKKMVYVVAAEASKIKSVIQLVHASGLKLESIDIGELAVRNIARRLLCDDDNERGIAVSRIQKASGSVYIYRGGNLYLARTFNLNYNGGLMDDLPEEDLALEIQRSLDYYERQMGQAPPSVVYICGDNITDHKVGATFKASLAVGVQVLDPSAVVLLDESVTSEALKRSFGALGGALRERAAN